MQVRDIASQPIVSCRAAASIGEVARTMHETNVGAVVVVNDERQPIGIVTDRDLVTRALARDQPASTAVYHFMTKELLLAAEDEPIDRVLQRASGWGCRRIPVVERSGVVTGMVSLDDLTAQVAESMAEIAQAQRAARHRH